MQASLAKPTLRAARPARRQVTVRADGGFLGSTTNIIMMTSVGLCLTAGKFGLAPTATKGTDAGLKMIPRKDIAGVLSKDPTGFSAVDVLTMGAAGHGIGIGIVLGLKGIGAI